MTKILMVGKKNNEATFRQVRNLPEIMKESIKDGLQNIGVDLKRFAQTGIEREPKTGRLYGVIGKGRNKKLTTIAANKRKRLHQASAPGEFPAILTGDFIKSIEFLVTGNDEMEFGTTDAVGKVDFLEATRSTLGRVVKEREKNAFNYLRWEKKLKK